MSVAAPSMPSTVKPAVVLRREGMADSIAILLSATVLQKGIGFARSVLFCLWLGAEQLGQWDLTLSFLMLAAPISVLSLPAVFGRYVQYYEQRGQLRMFLRRLGIATFALASASVLTVIAAAPWFSQLVFGQADEVNLVRITGVVLLAVIFNHSVIELAIALRLQRVASGVELLNSVLFAAGGTALVLLWQHSAAALVMSFGLASLLSALLALPWIWHSWHLAPAMSVGTGQLAFWSKIVPFAAWVWLSNWLGNLFALADRYMLVHYSQLSGDEALALVGQYHTSRVIPALLTAVCGLIATTIIPFLSHDWERGDRASVGRRLNLMLKLLGLALTFGTAIVLAISPMLFHLAFHTRFDAGLAVMTWTLMYAAWWGMLALAKTYLWCAERVRLASVAFLLGFVCNIGLNIVLLPRFGLLGAVWSTCLAHLVALGCVYYFAGRAGLHVQRGTWIASALPALLALGPWWALAALALVGVLATCTSILFNDAEKQTIVRLAIKYSSRLLALRVRPTAVPIPTDS